ncbi:MAG: transcriptional activator FtrB [Firmicutes bacterium]|nr:transcriptional activator FtrB [Bacillota bacterium]
MKEYISTISSMPLFAGIKEEDFEVMLDCIGSYVKTYNKGEFISLSGEPMKCVGIVLDGMVHMIKEDLWGNKSILVFIRKTELFGETFACGSRILSTVTFFAAANAKILFLPFDQVMHSCTKACIFHQRLIENMIRLIANKNAQLMAKLEVISKKTLREKIMTFLSLQAQLSNCKYFELPIGRLEMADYLCADRSALTRELCKMKQIGLIDFGKNTFRLLK